MRTGRNDDHLHRLVLPTQQCLQVPVVADIASVGFDAQRCPDAIGMQGWILANPGCQLIAKRHTFIGPLLVCPSGVHASVGDGVRKQGVGIRVDHRGCPKGHVAEGEEVQDALARGAPSDDPDFRWIDSTFLNQGLYRTANTCVEIVEGLTRCMLARIIRRTEGHGEHKDSVLEECTSGESTGGAVGHVCPIQIEPLGRETIGLDEKRVTSVHVHARSVHQAAIPMLSLGISP